MAWTTEGKKTNPNNGTVLAATDVLPYNIDLELTIMVTATTVVGSIILQYINSGNTVVLEHFIKVPVDKTEILEFGPVPITAGDYIRVIQDGTIIGNVQVSLGS